MNLIIYTRKVSRCIEGELLEYETAGKFLADLKKDFRKRDKKIVKIAELKRLKQRKRIMEKFVQKFKRAARGSKYEGRSLVLWQLLVIMTNSNTSNKSLSKISSGDYKRT